jgi:hypothetical protein
LIFDSFFNQRVQRGQLIGGSPSTIFGEDFWYVSMRDEQLEQSVRAGAQRPLQLDLRQYL